MLWIEFVIVFISRPVGIDKGMNIRSRDVTKYNYMMCCSWRYRSRLQGCLVKRSQYVHELGCDFRWISCPIGWMRERERKKQRSIMMYHVTWYVQLTTNVAIGLHSLIFALWRMSWVYFFWEKRMPWGLGITSPLWK